MKSYAIGYREGRMLDIDERDFKAASREDLTLLLIACKVRGEVEILEFVEGDYFDEYFSYNDMLEEQHRMN